MIEYLSNSDLAHNHYYNGMYSKDESFSDWYNKKYSNPTQTSSVADVISPSTNYSDVSKKTERFNRRWNRKLQDIKSIPVGIRSSTPKVNPAIRNMDVDMSFLNNLKKQNLHSVVSDILRQGAPSIKPISIPTQKVDLNVDFSNVPEIIGTDNIPGFDAALNKNIYNKAHSDIPVVNDVKINKPSGIIDRIKKIFSFKPGGKIDYDGITREYINFGPIYKKFADHTGVYEMIVPNKKDTIWISKDSGKEMIVRTSSDGYVGNFTDVYGNSGNLSPEEMRFVRRDVGSRTDNIPHKKYIIDRYGDEMLMPENKSNIQSKQEGGEVVNDKMANIRDRHRFAKQKSYSNGNTAYIMTVGPDLDFFNDFNGRTDTLITKKIGFRSPKEYSNEDLGHIFETTLPSVAKFFGYKSKYQQALDDIEKIKR